MAVPLHGAAVRVPRGSLGHGTQWAAGPGMGGTGALGGKGRVLHDEDTAAHRAAQHRVSVGPRTAAFRCWGSALLLVTPR